MPVALKIAAGVTGSLVHATPGTLQGCIVYSPGPHHSITATVSKQHWHGQVPLSVAAAVPAAPCTCRKRVSLWWVKRSFSKHGCLLLIMANPCKGFFDSSLYTRKLALWLSCGDSLSNDLQVTPGRAVCGTMRPSFFVWVKKLWIVVRIFVIFILWTTYWLFLTAMQYRNHYEYETGDPLLKSLGEWECFYG